MTPLGRQQCELKLSLLKNLFRKDEVPKNPALERAMRELAQSDNAQTRRSLYQALLDSTLIFHGSVSGGTELQGRDSPVAASDTNIAFKTIEHPPGTMILPVFTSVEALTSWVGVEVKWIALPARRIFQSIVPGNIREVRVNPYRPGQAISRPGGIITRAEFTALAQGLVPESNDENTTKLDLPAGEKLPVGACAKVPPKEVLEALSSYLQQFPALQGAYLFDMVTGGVPSTVLGLDLGAESGEQMMERILRGVGPILSRVMSDRTFIDFMELEAGPLLSEVQKCGRQLALSKHSGAIQP